VSKYASPKGYDPALPFLLWQAVRAIMSSRENVSVGGGARRETRCEEQSESLHLKEETSVFRASSFRCLEVVVINDKQRLAKLCAT